MKGQGGFPGPELPKVKGPFQTPKCALQGGEPPQGEQASGHCGEVQVHVCGRRAAGAEGARGAEQHACVEAALAGPAVGAEATASTQDDAASWECVGPQAEADVAKK